ncbi:MAG: response regulator transcription factor [Flavobacteriales bacterium]|nr:response regulator transcription factor [Flavobacteriales bacterium]
MSAIRVVLCDDHRIVTDGLRTLLEGAVGVECVGVASNGMEAIYLLEHIKVDVLLTDLDMPEMNGYELTSKVKERFPAVPVLVLSMHDEPAVVKRAMDVGADGYLVKSAGRDEVVLAIREVRMGHKHFGSGVMEAFMRSQVGGATNSELLKDLSEREIEVLGALAEGLGNKDIGERLFISPRTVDTHRTNLMRKLDTHNVAGLVRIAIKAGLVR